MATTSARRRWEDNRLDRDKRWFSPQTERSLRWPRRRRRLAVRNSAVEETRSRRLQDSARAVRSGAGRPGRGGDPRGNAEAVRPRYDARRAGRLTRQDGLPIRPGSGTRFYAPASTPVRVKTLPGGREGPRESRTGRAPRSRPSSRCVSGRIRAQSDRATELMERVAFLFSTQSARGKRRERSSFS